MSDTIKEPGELLENQEEVLEEAAQQSASVEEQPEQPSAELEETTVEQSEKAQEEPIEEPVAQFAETTVDDPDSQVSAKKGISVDKIKSFFIKLKDKIKNRQFTKKELIIIGVVFVVIIVLLFAVFHKSEFKKVQQESLHIAGMISYGNDYFTIDTYPDEYENMDDELARSILATSHQKKAIEAIKYANEELGFGGYLYSDMMKTTALMGRRSEENNKYRVSWTYHPDDGLEVTYTKK